MYRQEQAMAQREKGVQVQIDDVDGVMEDSDAGGWEKMDGEMVVVQQDDERHFADAVDAATPLTNQNSNQLTLLFQGEAYVFDSVTPEKVQAVMLLLGGCEVPSSGGGMPLQCQPESKGLEDILRRSNIPAKRFASLIRFREKRKDRCFDKKIRYNVRKEVAQRMQRRKGQFSGKSDPQEGTETSSSSGPAQSYVNETVRDSRCQNCGTSEKATPAMRRGPAGPRSLCNACGLMWANKGTLRSPSRANKMMGTQSSVVMLTERGVEIHDEDGTHEKKMRVNNHKKTATSAELLTEEIEQQKEELKEEDTKTGDVVS